MMIFIGFGIMIVSASGQDDQDTSILDNRGALAVGLKNVIEDTVDSISKVFDLSISNYGDYDKIHFTAKTVKGDIFEDFQCILNVIPKQSEQKVELLKCGSPSAKFKLERISISLSEFYNSQMSENQAQVLE